MSDKTTLPVKGMTCNNCASTVEGIIKQEGGDSVHVDYLMGEASFVIDDPERIEKIVKRINQAGYQASFRGSGHKRKRWSTVETKFLATLPFTLILLLHMFFPASAWINNPYLQLVLCLPVFAIGLVHFGNSTLQAVRSGTITMDALILLGTTSAFFYSLYGTIVFRDTHEAHDFLFYETASTIITLVLLGYVIEHRTVDKATEALRELYNQKPEKAKRLVGDKLSQKLEVVEADQLRSGDLILVNEGDRLPADGTVKHGTIKVNEAMLTGEADLIEKKAGDTVRAGSIVNHGNATIEVSRAGRHSTMGQIIELIKSSRADRPSVQKLADKVSSWFVPGVIAVAIITFVANYYLGQTVSDALLRAVAVLVIACPCAMGLATPTAVSVALGHAGKRGIIIKRAAVFEEIIQCDTVVMDKTGTLTVNLSEPSIELLSTTYPQETLLSLINTLEQRSSHPIAKTLTAAFSKYGTTGVDQVEEIKGKGLTATWSNLPVKLGSSAFTGVQHSGDLHLVIGQEHVLSINLGEQLHPAAKTVVSKLKKAGMRVVILSGDRYEKVKRIAEELDVDEFHAEQLPSQKLEYVASIGSHTLMVGDGINDAPALAKALVGVSIGNDNALAAESASVVIIGNKLDQLSELVELGAKTVKTIKQNLWWAFAYNLVAIPMAAVGLLNPMVAALSMAFSDVVVIGNSIRLNYHLKSMA